MSEKTEVYKEVKFKWKGALDLNELYGKLKEWLGDEGFKVKEEFYLEKIKPAGKEIDISWKCTQDKGKYIKWEASITFYITNMNEVEVEKDGKKLKLHQATHQLKYKAVQVINASDEFPEDSFINKFYKKFIMAEKIEEQMIELFKISHDLVQEIKTYFEMYNI